MSLIPSASIYVPPSTFQNIGILLDLYHMRKSFISKFPRWQDIVHNILNICGKMIFAGKKPDNRSNFIFSNNTAWTILNDSCSVNHYNTRYCSTQQPPLFFCGIFIFSFIIIICLHNFSHHSVNIICSFLNCFSTFCKLRLLNNHESFRQFPLLRDRKKLERRIKAVFPQCLFQSLR